MATVTPNVIGSNSSSIEFLNFDVVKIKLCCIRARARAIYLQAGARKKNQKPYEHVYLG
jgi:hypothetical protein